ncbi:MAG: hypothetical protein FWE19_00545 [Oscillospiraceae bacterium]|nr:hypothetical protein [Oscillospiraceae bacterium]
MKLDETILTVIRHLHNGGVADTWLDVPTRGEFVIDSGNIVIDSDDFVIGDWVLLVDNAKRYSGIFLLGEPVGATSEPPKTPLYALKNGTDDESPVDGKRAFVGAIYRLVLPVGFVALCSEIRDFMLSDEGAPTLLSSEKVIGAYSWTAATGKDGQPLTWAGVFKDKLPPFVMFSSLKI